MTEVKDGRFGVTLLDSDFSFLAENDELMVNKRTGRLYYKTKLGELIDIFDRYASNVSEARLDDLEDIMWRVMKLVTENGPSKMVHFKYALTAEEDGQVLFKIPLSIFDRQTDLLILNIASTIPLDEAQYIINENNDIVLSNGIELGTKLMILIIKNMPHIDGDGKISGDMILDGTIGIDQFSSEVVTLINNNRVGVNTIKEEHLSKELIDKINSKTVVGTVAIENFSNDLRTIITQAASTGGITKDVDGAYWIKIVDANGGKG